MFALPARAFVPRSRSAGIYGRERSDSDKKPTTFMVLRVFVQYFKQRSNVATKYSKYQIPPFDSFRIAC